MNTKKRKVFVIIFVLIFSITIILIKIFHKNPNDSINNKNQTIWNFENKLNNNNYDKIWINPEKYNTFNDFLKDFKSFSWVKFNPEKEDFVIAVDNWSWSITYIPFNKESNYTLNNKTYKNLAILDIYDAYKKWKIYWWKNTSLDSKIIFENDVKHKETYSLNQIFWKNSNVNVIVNELEKVENIWSSKKELLAYLYDFKWNYWSWNGIRTKLCKDNPIYCENYIDISIEWKIVDNNNNPINWAKITLLNDNKISSISDNNGNYKLTFKWYAFSHIRLKSTKNWFTDWFFTLSINSYENKNWPNNYNINFNLNKPEKNIILDDNNANEHIKWWYYVFKSSQSTYFIPINWIYYLDWKKYEEKYISVYLYELNKWSNMDNMLNNDTFEPVYGYVWNIMKTFWMPYIQLFDSKWNELYIKSSNPMILQNQIYHMKELYANYDKIYEALTKDDMKKLVKISNESSWYPIDFEYLTKNNFLRWPAWWCLDRKTWIWSSVWHRVLNEDWLVELPFYSIKDN